MSGALAAAKRPEACSSPAAAPARSVTVLDVALSRGIRESEGGGYNGSEFERVGLPMFGGCERCEASLAAYNAHPSRSGFLRCAACIGDAGYPTAEAFNAEHPEPFRFDVDGLVYVVELEDGRAFLAGEGESLCEATTADEARVGLARFLGVYVEDVSRLDGSEP